MTKKVLILFLGDINFDSRSLKFAKTLSENSYQVTILTVNSTYKSDGKFEIINLDLPYKNKVPFLKYYIKAFRALFLKKFDIILSSDLYSLPIAFIKSITSNSLLYYDSREFYSSIAGLKNKKIKQKIWISIEKFIIKYVHKIFTVNNSIAGFLKESYPKTEPIVVFNYPYFHNITKVNIREILHLDPDKKIILYQGGLQIGRGIPIYLRIIEKIDNAVLLFMGKGNLESEIVKHPLFNNKIFLLNNISATELLNYTSSVDIGLCIIEKFGKSYFYSLPNKLFEFVHAGIPIIGSDFPEISFIISKYELGFCVNPDVETEIIEKINLALNAPDIYNNFRNNCLKSVHKFSWQSQEQNLLSNF